MGRSLSHRITPAAVEFYRRRDFSALHRELRLAPFHRSPLPIFEHALGVDQGEPPEYERRGPWRDSWYAARELQAELEAAASSHEQKD